jgi:hypothetical protein
MPSLPAAIEHELCPPGDVEHGDLYVEAAHRSPSFLAVATPIITQRVRDDDLGPLYVGRVIELYDRYLNCIEPDAHGQFVAQFASYLSFWEEVDAAAFNDNTIALLLKLAQGADGEADVEDQSKARDRLIARLGQIDEKVWEAAVRNGREPLPIALATAELPGRATPLGKPLVDVLDHLMPELLSAFDRKVATRWFQAVSLLGLNARRTLLKNLRDRINGGAESAALTDLMDVGGAVFLKEAEFSKDADSSVRHIVLPLVDQPEKLDWLLANQKSHGLWIADSSPETKGFLAERLHDQWLSSSADDRLKLKKLSDCFGLPTIGGDGNAKDRS